jgi:hypothetical protein
MRSTAWTRRTPPSAGTFVHSVHTGVYCSYAPEGEHPLGHRGAASPGARSSVAVAASDRRGSGPVRVAPTIPAVSSSGSRVLTGPGRSRRASSFEREHPRADQGVAKGFEFRLAWSASWCEF